MSEDSTKGGSKGVEEIRRSLGPGKSGTFSGTLPLPSQVPPSGFFPSPPPCPACGGPSHFPPLFLQVSPHARARTSSRSTGESCETDRDGTHAGKLSNLSSTLPFSIFYTPLLIFFIVLCYTYY